ncbi:hypothetical protein [Rhodococcus sp. 66b]|uniref:hypothetical protein n=1 Tax=Rhodococcus sp. 66b TaxID=1945511 RepID=UPI0009BA5F2F|nr:hypothetical protein [Rhodococcus sp. 66b]
MQNESQHEPDPDGTNATTSAVVSRLTNESLNLGQRIEQINTDQIPALIESDGRRAWIVPERLWTSIQSIASIVNNPELAKEQREKQNQLIHDEYERLANDPEDLAAIRQLRDDIYGSR